MPGLLRRLGKLVGNATGRLVACANCPCGDYPPTYCCRNPNAVLPNTFYFDGSLAFKVLSAGCQGLDPEHPLGTPFAKDVHVVLNRTSAGVWTGHSFVD